MRPPPLCNPKFGLERLKSISRTQRHRVFGNPLSPPSRHGRVTQKSSSKNALTCWTATDGNCLESNAPILFQMRMNLVKRQKTCWKEPNQIRMLLFTAHFIHTPRCKRCGLATYQELDELRQCLQMRPAMSTSFPDRYESTAGSLSIA